MRRRICQLVTMQPGRWVAAILLVGVSLVCFGQADPPSPTPQPSPRLLLLFDGRVIIGDISEIAGGYAVRRSEGSITVPFEFVRLSATSLAEAYEKQRENLENPNAEQHLNLARWCLRHRLEEQAVVELEAALELEPFRKEARELLKLIDSAETGPHTAEPRSARGPSTMAPQEQTSGGISPANHLTFVRRVQPLLVNKCGNATCHGSASTNGLRLHNVRTGRQHQRVHSDENLAMVLDFVDADFPLQSPLLRHPRDPDSTNHRGVFAGALGTQQAKLLNDWIHEVAVDRQLAHESPTPFVTDRQPAIEQTGLSEDPPSAPRGPRIIEFPQDPHDPASPRSSDLLRNILDQERPDPFDPQEFNRRVHGVDG